MEQNLRSLPYDLAKAGKTNDKEGLNFKFEGKKYLRWLYKAAFILVALNVIAIFSKYFTDHPNAWGIIPQFLLDNERNIPTYFSSFILLASSVLLFFIAELKRRRKSKFTWHWRLLAMVFLYMSVDESAGVHEMFIYPLRDNFNLTGIFYFSWVIVGSMLVLGLGFYYLRFLFSLEPKLRLGMIAAGGIYVIGALGVELFGGYYASTYGLDNVTYSLITTVEETLEIVGVLVFITVLYNYLKEQLAFVHFGLGRIPAEVSTIKISPRLKVVEQLEGLN